METMKYRIRFLLTSFVLFGAISTRYAWAQTPSAASESKLSIALSAASQTHPKQSGFYLIPDGLDAFLARLAAIEVAEKSIEAQYYIFKNDLTGRLFLERLLLAADRGVRVRLLVDDLAKTWKDKYLAMAVAHPNFEMRLFNPPPRIGSLQPVKFLDRLRRIHRRMHNKEFVIDGKLAIVGGRNIADEYFGASERKVTDLDAIVIGEAVPELVRIFDDYWHYRLSVPVESVALKKKVSEAERIAFRNQLRAWNESAETQAYVDRLKQQPLLSKLESRQIPFYWGVTRVHVDQPRKIGDLRFKKRAHMTPTLAPYASLAKEELVLVSPYFIPGKQGSKRLKAIAEKGVNVVVVTNSLDSNDHALVHSAYMKYRKRLLESGVQLLETMALVDGENSDPKLEDFSRNSLLHTKLFVVDQRYVMIGSLNLDPRSRLLNTELLLVLDSPKLAADLTSGMKLVLQENFWKLELGENEKIQWTTTSDPSEKPVLIEPGTNWLDRQKLRLLSLLPIEAQL